MKILRKLIFLVFILILTACGGGREEFRKTLAKGRVNTSNFTMDMTIEDIEAEFGKPGTEQEILDWGYYGYEDFGIFFNNKLTYIEGVEVKETNKAENSVAFVRWFKNISIFGVILDFTKTDKLFELLGQPDELYIIKPEDKYGSFFSGQKFKYISGKYSLIVGVNDRNTVTDIILGPKDLKL